MGSSFSPEIYSEISMGEKFQKLMWIESFTCKILSPTPLHPFHLLPPEEKHLEEVTLPRCSRLVSVRFPLVRRPSKQLRLVLTTRTRLHPCFVCSLCVCGFGWPFLGIPAIPPVPGNWSVLLPTPVFLGPKKQLPVSPSALRRPPVCLLKNVASPEEWHSRFLAQPGSLLLSLSQITKPHVSRR